MSKVYEYEVKTYQADGSWYANVQSNVSGVIIYTTEPQVCEDDARWTAYDFLNMSFPN